ncbi:hypothetical protein CDD80_4154 [Ophiocordyceps camponoti-rufipedis]|uniref:Uncharacterized protein n=1 Tax=Ophiocordyceps camponoti-rufipedis TaxID=2004952 RepID=A0A2C5XVF8_9HYPO|nr:hypothetical protein CDD80_4154 [Ophiocordyceps camponoti-rufipedis]
MKGLCFFALVLAAAAASLSKRDAVPLDENLYPEPKYFKEAFGHAHYDARFMTQELDEEPHRDVLRILIQTYLATCRALKIMPWDKDADVQVTEVDLYYLAAHYNKTVYYYKYGDMKQGRFFLLDVNPHFEHRETDDALNFIDARWIDMATGLFIDITAARYHLEHPAGEGILYDKNGHEFRDTYVYPLRNTTFEGVQAMIPFRYKEMLESEYGKEALTETTFNGYVFDVENQQWHASGPRQASITITTISVGTARGEAAVSSSWLRQVLASRAIRRHAAEYQLTTVAVGRERRADRLNERLRGAQRINVDDESFNLHLDGLSNQPVDSPAQRSAKVSDRKRKRHSKEKPDDFNEEEVSQRSEPLDGRSRRPPIKSARQNGTTTARNGSPAASLQPIGEADGPEGEQEAPRTLSPMRRRLADVVVEEEVAESPSHAPGSGQRRRVLQGAFGNSTTEMQGTMSTDATAPPSSPLTSKSRRHDVAATPKNPTTLRNDEPDELSPDHHRDAPEDEELPSLLAVESSRPLPETPGPVEEAEDSADEAEEMDAVEAAKTLGKKRKRNSIRISPELGSGFAEAETEEPPLRTIRIQKRPGKSPALQRQPASRPDKGAPSRDGRRQKQKTDDRPAPKQKADEEPAPKKKAGRKPAPKKRADDKPAPKRAAASKKDGDDDDGDDGVEITVQRFVNHKRRGGEADEADPLHSDMAFANRPGETVVDVFAQVCDEVVASTLAQFQQLLETADGAAKKKECRIKMRAVEAYREELRSRLLQHAIHLNDWHTLRRQVRKSQKEKLAMREEIMRLNGEREQVALRMDAVRVKHEADSREATRRIDTSALMHDVDLAVEQGRDAPRLSREVQRQAQVANLELLIAQVSEAASSSSSTGGLLHQVREFNAFLERAALALESRS